MLTLINSYAPATKQFQQKYFETLTQTIHAFHSQHPIILAGDFNNTKERDRHRNYYKALEYLLETHNLTDTFEQANPTKIDTAHTSAITITSHRPQRLNSTHRHRQHPTTSTEKKITTLEIQQHPIRKQKVHIPHTQTHTDTPRRFRNRGTKRASVPTMGTSQNKTSYDKHKPSQHTSTVKSKNSTKKY